MGVARRWEEARTAALVAECGAGKTLIALAASRIGFGEN
jgi:superfamily II DNA or RNA helicase